MSKSTFYEILTAAVNDIAEHGFDSAERVAAWQARLREAAERSLRRPSEMERMLREAMTSIYRRLIDKGQVLKFHPGIPRFTIDRIAPKLRAQLDSRIAASADLIKLNREQAIESTLRRFSGWASSVPAGGSRVVDRTDEKKAIRKSLAGLPFEERRVLIDQGQKLRSAISETVAQAGNAIACVWHDHHTEANYDYRPEHKARDGHVYAVRGNWAIEKGLMKAGPDGYSDEIERPSELPFCRCYYEWMYTLSALPGEMLTEKGRVVLSSAKAEIARMRKI